MSKFPTQSQNDLDAIEYLLSDSPSVKEAFELRLQDDAELQESLAHAVALFHAVKEEKQPKPTSYILQPTYRATWKATLLALAASVVGIILLPRRHEPTSTTLSASSIATAWAELKTLPSASQEDDSPAFWESLQDSFLEEWDSLNAEPIAWNLNTDANAEWEREPPHWMFDSIASNDTTDSGVRP